MSDWAFVEHATNQLMRPRPGDSKPPTLWPSEASGTYVDDDGEEVVVGKCRRARFFRYLTDLYKFDPKYKMWKPLVDKLLTEARPVDKYMRWIWAAGDQAEEFLIEQSKRSGIYVADQVPIYVPGHNISGKKDIEVHNPTTSLLSIIEAKSVYGFGANRVLGSPTDRRRGVMGTPRESNLLQIAIYHWWTASADTAYEDSRLTYIARDTGRYAEYLVRTVVEEETIWIEYRPWHPYMGRWIRVPYTMNSVLKAYEETQNQVDGGILPPRDFEISWDDERIEKAIRKGELGKTDTEKYRKAQAVLEYNAWVETIEELEDARLVDSVNTWEELLPAKASRAIEAYKTVKSSFVHEEGEGSSMDEVKKAFAAAVKELRKLKPKKELKKIEKGDWQCRFCKWADTCYSKDGTPRELQV